MSSSAIATIIQADATDLLAVLRAAAMGIDFSASAAAATAASGAIDIAKVSGLSLLDQIDAAGANLVTLVAAPATLASTLVGLVQAFAGTTVDFRALADDLAAVSWSANWRWRGINALKIGNNRDALQTLVVNQAVIEAARAASSATFDSQDAAFALGDDLAARLNAAIANSGSRAMRASLRALRTALLADINTRAAPLNALESWSNAGTVPAVVLASRIYDDPSRAAEIARRNAVANPLFVPAGTLTILTPGASA